MDPPDAALPARLDGQNVASPSTVTPKEAIAGKFSYANSVTTKPGSTLPPVCHEREAVIARQTTHNGMPAVIFETSDYYGIMAAECRLTIVGRFLKPRPQIDRIRSSFKETITVKGSTRIGVFDNFNVFMDFTNEEDFNSVWYKRVLTIDGQQMWLQKWSPDFKPEEDLPIASVWVLLPDLPFHLHTWHYIKQLVSNVGTPLELDNATRSKTRPSMANVRVEIDLLKPQPDSIWVGLENDTSPLWGFTQKLEYEGIPKYCRFCKKLGHLMVNCRALERKKMAETKELEKQTIGSSNNEGAQNEKKFMGNNEHLQDVENVDNEKDVDNQENNCETVVGTDTKVTMGTRMKSRNKDRNLPMKKTTVTLKATLQAKKPKKKRDMKNKKRNKMKPEKAMIPQVQDFAATLSNVNQNKNPAEDIRENGIEVVANILEKGNRGENDINVDTNNLEQNNTDENSVEVDDNFLEKSNNGRCNNNGSQQLEHNNIEMIQESSNTVSKAKQRKDHTSTDLEEIQGHEEESCSIPSKFKDLPGLDLVVDLNLGTPPESGKTQKLKYIPTQNIESSPDGKIVTAWAVGNPSNYEAEEIEDIEGFSPVKKGRNKNKKNGRNTRSRKILPSKGDAQISPS